MKRLVPALILALMMCGCAAKNPEQPAENSQTEPVSESSSAASSEREPDEPNVLDEPTETTESTEPTEPIKSEEQQRLERLILAQVTPEEGKELLGEAFGDLDGDGREELFAFYGAAGEYYENAVAGELYFASGDAAEKLLKENEYTSPHTFLAEGDILYTAEEQYATGSISRVFAVRGSRAVAVKFGFEAHMMIHHIDGNEFEAFHSTYDLTDNIGHSWKPYWYYYSREETAFIPFSAQEITTEQFMEYEGAAEAVEQIKSAAGDEYTLLLFDNGVVCANFVVDTINKHFTWRITENGLVDITEYGSGHPADGRYLIPQDYQE